MATGPRMLQISPASRNMRITMCLNKVMVIMVMVMVMIVVMVMVMVMT